MSDYKLVFMDSDPKIMDHESFAQLVIRLYGSRSVCTDRDPYVRIAIRLYGSRSVQTDRAIYFANL